MERASVRLLFKWLDDFSAEADGARQKFVEALFGSGFVDGSQDVKELAPHWCVASIRDAGEILGECFCVSMGCPVDEVAFELLVGGAVDADAGVPFGLAAALGGDWAASVGYGIAFKADRVAAAVADLVSFLLLESVMAFRGK